MPDVPADHSNPDYLRQHIADQAVLAQIFGDSLETAEIREIGDGNLNYIYRVQSSDAQMAIKHAPNFSRMSGGARALTPDRLKFEARALQLFRELAPEHIPEVYDYNSEASILAMRFLSPHKIMRKGLIEGNVYPLFADHISTYLANTLFGTSDYAMLPAQKRPLVAEFALNVELCEITERLVFNQAFAGSQDNNWTTPQLDKHVTRLQTDPAIRLRVEQLKLAFLTRTDALLHGDLHSGSVLLTQDETYLFDTEFATFGPMGFDIGMLIGNLFLAYFALPAHGASAARCDGLLDDIESIWTGFERKFTALWQDNRTGGAFSATRFEDAAGSVAARSHLQAYLAQVLNETAGFAAVEIVRRVIGRAHVIEFDSIEDAKRRAPLEAAALDMACAILGRAAPVTDIAQLTAAARNVP